VIGTPESEAAALAEIRDAWKEEGRDETGLYTTIIGGGCVLRPGESPDSPRARAQAGPMAAMAFHSIVEQEAFGTDWYQGFPFPEALARYREAYQAYPADERHLANHRGHLMFLRPEETHITGDVIGAMTLTGPRDALVERVRAIRDAGYDQLKITLPPGQEEDMLTSWMEVLERV
jgi:5,10-methylenetetrahydromethanopterin reductase